MLEIKPIEIKSNQEKLCALCGVAYNKNALAYSAYEGETPLGICQFYLDDEYGYIYDLENVKGVDDFEALFIMGRAVLNFIDLCGTHKALFCGEESRLTKAVGFSQKDGKLFIDLEGFFENHCSHDKK